MKYIIMFILSIGFFGESYTSHIKMVHVITSSDLKPAEQKKIALESFIVNSFTLDRSKLETKQGISEELRRFIEQSNFRGHFTVAREVFFNHLRSRGFKIAENLVSEQRPLLRPVVLQQEQSTDRAMKMFREFHDKYNYPTDVYFQRLINYLNEKKDPDLEWYFKNS